MVKLEFFNKDIFKYWWIAWLFNVLVVELFVSGFILSTLILKTGFPSLKIIATLFVYYGLLSYVISFLIENFNIIIGIIFAIIWGQIFEIFIAKTTHDIQTSIGYIVLYGGIFYIPYMISGKWK